MTIIRREPVTFLFIFNVLTVRLDRSMINFANDEETDSVLYSIRLL